MQSAPANGAPSAGAGKTLAPAIWDRLEAKAAELGGVGFGMLFDVPAVPCCLYGIAQVTDGVHCGYDFQRGGSDTQALLSTRVFFDSIDAAVHHLIRRGRRLAEDAPIVAYADDRVDFESLMLELGISRGEEVAHA